jgi:hypothetical protein
VTVVEALEAGREAVAMIADGSSLPQPEASPHVYAEAARLLEKAWDELARPLEGRPMLAAYDLALKWAREAEASRVPVSHSLGEIVLPVDRTQRQLAGGGPVTSEHAELKENGQQRDYIVLSAEERAKGFVRPVRRSYVHKKCGAVTKMARAIAETYARDPGFYSSTFCVRCGTHLPLVEFVWLDDPDQQVGS